MGVAVGDYDGDGDEDLYVTQVGANRLLRNDGGGRFEDVTREAGVGDTRWGTSAGFFDYDMDGDLDLFVTNYIDWSLETEQDCFDPTGQPDYCSPTTYSAPGRDTLFRNDGGVFVDVTEAAGLAEIYGNGLGVVFGDYDADGDLDMFVANDQMADQLWRNEGDGTFVDVGEMVGVARDPMGGVRAGMGVDAADVDDDGDLDLLVVHLAREKDGFFRNRGSHFVEETTRVGIGLGTFRMTRFGVGFHDFDGDGHLDLFVANGRVNLMMAALDELDPYAEPNTLMRGTGRGTWEVVSPAGGTVMPRMATSRGAAFGDVNGDGAPDVVVVNRDGPADLFINCAPRSGRSLTLRLEDEEGALAQGARASLSLGDRRIRRDVKPAYSYCSASDSRLHFGLGEMAEVEAVGRLVSVDGDSANIEWKMSFELTIDDIFEMARDFMDPEITENLPQDADGMFEVVLEAEGVGVFDLSLGQLVSMDMEGEYSMAMEMAMSQDGMEMDGSAEMSGSMEMATVITVE